MFCRIFILVLILNNLPKTLVGQSIPSFSKVPNISDKTFSGTGQGKTADYDSVVLYICSSRTEPVPPLDCSAEDGAKTRKVKLVNLGGSPFPISGKDGKFSITLGVSFPPGTYVWLDQVTVSSNADKVRKSTTSNPVRIPVPLLRKATLSVSGSICRHSSRSSGSASRPSLRSHGHGRDRRWL